MTALHTLSRSTRTKGARVGRGGKRGKTSGRGGKGQTARAGHKVRPEIRDMIKKLPKLRGHGKNRARTVSDARVTYVPVNLPALDVFAAGETVSPQTLVEKKVIAMVRGRLPAVKILGSGEITKALTLQGCAVSKGAKAAIEKAGGSVA